MDVLIHAVQWRISRNEDVKDTDPVLVTELLFQVSVDLLNMVQVIHCHCTVLLLLTHLRALQLFCQGFNLHL